jgi:hypothetical protein
VTSAGTLSRLARTSPGACNASALHCRASRSPGSADGPMKRPKRLRSSAVPVSTVGVGSGWSSPPVHADHSDQWNTGAPTASPSAPRPGTGHSRRHQPPGPISSAPRPTCGRWLASAPARRGTDASHTPPARIPWNRASDDCPDRTVCTEGSVHESVHSKASAPSCLVTMCDAARSAALTAAYESPDSASGRG